MKVLRIVIGLYQLVAAVWAVLIILPQLESSGLWLAILAFFFCGVSFISGAVSLVFDRLGWKFTLVNQFIQLVAVFSPVFTFIVSVGVAFRPYVGLTNTDSGFMDARPVVGYLSRAGADFGVAFFQSLEGFPQFGLALNLVALAIIVVGVRALKKKIPPA